MRLTKRNGSVNNNDSNGDAAHNSFHKSQRRERELELLESNRPNVRPLRLLPVGKKQPLSEEDKAFLREARLKHFPLEMLTPCPKIKDTPSRTRYMASITAKTIPELIELGAYSSDINWDFKHGFIRFPGHESERSGHIFANVSLRKSRWKTDDRSTAFNVALEVIDEEIADAELEELLDDCMRTAAVAEECALRLMALTAASPATSLSNFVDWHIAAKPSHYNETLENVCSEHREWKSAMDEELLSMQEFDVFDIIGRHAIPRGRQILGYNKRK